MLALREYYSQQEQVNEWRRQARQWRLAQLASANGKQPRPLYRPALAWLGCRLMALGRQLQALNEA